MLIYRTAPACLTTAIVLLLLLTSTVFAYIHGSDITIDGNMQAYNLPGGLLAEREGFGRNATGGLGGSVYHVTSLADGVPGSLREAAESPDPLWIVFDVSGTINLGYQINVRSNKTIDGRGAEITITGYGLKISGVSNIIVTNLVFDTASEPNQDAIRIYNGAHDIWVHHCDFTNWTDGCVDITERATDVTVSWCKFWNHHKTMLIGASPLATGDVVIRVTLHHNFFDGTQTRHPRLRFGKVDAYNNYLYNWASYGMATCMFGQLLVEANIFEAGADKDAVITIYGDDPERGYAKLVEDSNLMLNGAIANENEPEQVFNRSTYYTATIETADNTLKEKIMAGAGVRKRGVTRYPWSKFHHDLNNTGYTKSPAPRTNKLLWITRVGFVAAGGPAVVDGLVFIGSTSYRMYALNMTTGEQVWNYATGARIRSAPAVADGVVYIASEDGKLYALDAATGALEWSYQTGDIISRSHPAVVDGIVYIGSYDKNVYALDAATGALEWSYQTGDKVRGCPAVVDGIVYIGSADNRTYALNATTGEQVWNYTTGGDIRGSPAVAGGLVFFGSNDDKVYALTAGKTGGDLVWNYTTAGDVRSTPAVAYGKVFIGSLDAKLYCFNATEENLTDAERLIWSYQTGGVGGENYASPAVADGKVFFGSRDGKVYCFNATEENLTDAERLIWSYQTGDEIRCAPAVADGFVFIGSKDEFMYAFGALPKGPEASFTFSPDSPDPGENVTFDASDSQPGWNVTERPIISYEWDFDDGNVTTVTVPTITHSYAAEGTYTVTLTVTAPGAVPETDSTSKTIVIDATDPTIVDVVQSPAATEVDPDENVTVTAINVTDNVAVDKVLLRWSNDNVTFHNVTMSRVSGTNNYTGQIPGQDAGTYVTYKIFANDTSGNSYETELNYTYRVIPEFPTWTSILLILIVFTFAIAIYKRRLIKTPIH